MNTPIYDRLWLESGCITWELPPQLNVDFGGYVNYLMSGVIELLLRLVL